MKLRVKRIGDHKLPLPGYMSDGAAAFDLHACFWDRIQKEPWWRLRILSSEWSPYLISCGFAFEIPQGYVGRIVDRSGFAKKGTICTGGVIDSDYRGEVFVCIQKRGPHILEISHGDRIAQMLIQPSPQVDLIEVDELSDTFRGDGGFGSTGR